MRENFKITYSGRYGVNLRRRIALIGAVVILTLQASLFSDRASASIADMPLIDLTANMNLLGTKDASISKISIDGSPMVKVDCGHAQLWPSLIINAPESPWDLSRYENVAFDVHNPSNEPLFIRCRIDNPGSDGDAACIYDSAIVPAGVTRTIQVPVNPSPKYGNVHLFGMRIPPQDISRDVFSSPDHLDAIDPSRISAVYVLLEKPQRNETFEVGNLRATGQYQPAPQDGPSFFPFIDTFGQYIHQDWPGKIHRIEDLFAAREAEQADLQQHPSPSDWDEYGGYAAGPSLQATGFFRTQKYNGKWWLVDPAGHLFFSHGVDCVGYIQATPIDERSSWFEDFPGDQPEFRSLIRRKPALLYHFGGKSPRTFSFDSANLIRKYGPDWLKITGDLDARRLRSWGFNTISLWSAPRVIHAATRTPYIDSFGVQGKAIEASKGYWSKFSDVFDPSFAAEAMRQARDRISADESDDRWCIGYFVDNELSWGRDEVSLAIATLRSPATQPAKLAFLEQLKTKYGDISQLNRTWGTDYSSWDALLQSRTPPSEHKAHADLLAFETAIADQYFKTIRDAVKSVAPNQLYLGCRFSDDDHSPISIASAAKYCDVVSFNLYQLSIGNFQLPPGVDMPLIASEFGFGALDHGVFGYGAVNAGSETGRADAYNDYLNSALADPHFVGTQFFQFADEPTTGRVFDGEDFEMGFVDICDTPYPEMVGAARQVGARMYDARLKN